MSSHPWHGLFPALWTPTTDSGTLAEADLADQVQFLRHAGADGLMALGSTGEFVHLDLAQRKAVLRLVAETAPGWPVIANCSDVSPRIAQDLGRYARSVGAAAVSLLPPWYFAHRPEDVAEFMVRGAEAAGIPLVIYNFPERTGHRLDLATIASVCDRVPVAALKQSGADFDYHRELAALGREKGFTLITGADTRIPEAFALGARGVISGLANAVPEWVLGVLRAVQAGNPAAAAAPSALLAGLMERIEGLAFPLDVEVCMAARGRPTGAPKMVLSASTIIRAQAARSRLETWIREGLAQGTPAQPTPARP